MTGCKGERKRAYAPKTRSGCKTCKQRRIKCDEAKPFCKRCTSTGRQCEGYATNDKSLVQVKPITILPKSVMTTIIGNSRDELDLEYFSRVTGPKIAGFYDDLGFWTGSVVQLGHTEPAIRLAIQAVSSLHAEVERLEGRRIKEINPTILADYNTAIRQLVSRTSDPVYIKGVVVALFVCIEYLVGNEEAAAIHINGGLKLLQDWRNRSNSSTSSSPDSDSSSPRGGTASENELVDELTSTFSRLAVHSKVFGKRMHNLGLLTYDDAEKQDFHFETAIQARDEGFVLLSDAIGFVSKATPAAYTQRGAEQKFFRDQTEMKRRLQSWRKAYKDFARQHQMTLTQMQIRGGNMIQALIICAYVWTCTCLTPYEEDYDRYTEDFQEVIDLSRTILDIPDEFLCNNVGRFQLDMGLIPALHLTGSRCRVPSVRKDAIEMLAGHHWREGLFDSFRSAEFIAVCTELEEQRKKELMGLKDHELADYLPCEGARIHFVGIDEQKDFDGKEVLVHSFYTKPYGAYGDWHVQQCKLHANPTEPSIIDQKSTDIRMVPNSAYQMPNIYEGRAYQNSGSFNPEVLAENMEKSSTFRVPNEATTVLDEKSNGMFYMHLMGAGVRFDDYYNRQRHEHDALI